MRIRVEHTLDGLARDFKRIPADFYRNGRKVVAKNARDGGLTARRIAKHTAGTHGKYYPGDITWDRSGRAFVGFGGGEIAAEYGPDSSRPQGRMHFETGSRNQPPHRDLEQSLDLIRPAFHRDVDHLVADLFWPGEG